ncbi:apolipoprotein N-acyltransferase [Saccharopolyspora kobensis]|uniref:Apolipoprotein N-acyltransferase n=1 Tax=Saccharopolyspora kobensis TaxID=146035 RepID=A0A1H6EEB4_9PSEU|nr:nitrilase-related carbon-nitrogen hydrolase [Saccharopolyspora kobensis]SEG96140.1 apolipoprotein N-acyltransferase [Saccharopolyspora kobensis]SFD21941.1 apolipoprotein N-acyltransferase [Saccharopolyspora kobensis]
MGSRRSEALAALIGSAALFYFGTGLAPLPALTWLAPLPVLLVAPRVSGGVAAAIAFAALLIGMTNLWGWSARSHDLPLWPWGLVASIGFALTFLLVVVVFRALLRRGRPLLAVLAGPAVWVALLHLISLASPAGIVGTLATAQADVPVVLQIAAVTGSLGVDYLVLLVPSAIAAALTSAATGRIRVLVTAGVVLVLALGGGALRLTGEPGPAQPVALIAHNQSGWAPDLATREGHDLVTAYAAEIAALPPGVRTVVLPEAAFGSTEARPAVLVEPMSRLAEERGLDVVTGFAHRDGGAKYNYALTFPALGGDPVPYLKQHDTVSPPGNAEVFPPTTGARLGLEVCADVNFRDPTSAYATAGAELLAIPASDERDNGWQHSRTALLRAVESGVPIAWSGRETTQLLTDGWGRVIADAPTGGPTRFTTLVAEVPTGPGPTPYAHLGDWFPWLCLAFAVIAAVAARGERAGS